MTIVNEILEIRKNRLIAGQSIRRIELTEQQRAKLKLWAKSQKVIFTAPDGSKRVIHGWRYECGRILGMDFDP